ncbi:uncharacterized protein SETTUDRAFT_161316 [Exserohilum turcica Et28A]|uniref:Cytochrome P450 n=1 Tax=Exserohilum turcicum (strain 28A) TaxID=671987 RepID=R0IN47_EXST2|nr:uncharacterized protein SETTUDRAFT_161316 [Exserohilum turcica Et28A]EOA86440.1 hypothetical protein SETTUDRAFT_161316 [Exserohilum turcica Et28A]
MLFPLDFSTQNWPSAVFAVSVGIFLLWGLIASWRPRFPNAAPKLLKKNLPIVGSLGFFTRRRDFCNDGASNSKTGNYSFSIGRYNVVGVSGLQGRKVFYESKELNMTDGYAALLTGTPDFNVTENGVKFDAWFSKKLIKHLKKATFEKSLPFLIDDVASAMDRISAICGARGGMFDPFDEMNRIVYHLTMRTIGVREIADSPDLLEKSLRLIETIDKGSSPVRILFPWFPTFKHIKRSVAGIQFYLMVSRIIEDRRKTGRQEDDIVQQLMDEGESTFRIVSFLIMALLAALLNSGINAAWVLCYLALNPQWQAQVRGQIDKALSKHPTGSPQDPIETLRRMTLDEWEAEFPLINLCLQESIRLQTVGTAFRKNVGGRDLKLEGTGEVIPKGGFVAYPIDDVHMNADIYTEPLKFDPGRYMAGREEDKKVPLGFVGWGYGRHACCKF